MNAEYTRIDPLSGFSHRACWIILAIVLLFMGFSAIGQERQPDPVADVFKVMELATGNQGDALWPEFKVSELPVLVFDGLKTYLFHSSTMPDGFARAAETPNVWVYAGQHPQVRGNSMVRLGETLTATSVLSDSSRRTGEKYGLQDMAGIIVHEQFHVFLRLHHPHWRQNDGLLLRYPDDTPDVLYLRQTEKEAFRRAVVSEGEDEIIGWVKTALRTREERLGLLVLPFALYEKELQRTEGLSDYIERVARGQDPLKSISLTDGIAPAGIRDLGYVEGRWIAMILDKLNPDWKSRLEEDDSLYLEDILKAVVDASPIPKKAFGGAEIEAMKVAAVTDFDQWQARKKAEIEEYTDAPGYRIEILSSANPFAIRLFDPLEMEILADGGVYHRVFFSAGNENGSLRIMNHPCLTWFNDTLLMTRLLIHRLRRAPEIVESEKKMILKDDNISIELKYSSLSVNNDLYTVDL